MKCAADGCQETCESHRWRKQRAQDEGWFFQRNGQVWCPVHTPKWVAAWRAKKAESK